MEIQIPCPVCGMSISGEVRVDGWCVLIHYGMEKGKQIKHFSCGFYDKKEGILKTWIVMVVEEQNLYMIMLLEAVSVEIVELWIFQMNKTKFNAEDYREMRLGKKRKARLRKKWYAQDVR